MSIFQADSLSINFGGIKAVDGVSFDVEQGEVFTIIGPNGAGKTTIFNLVSRIYEPTGGRRATKIAPNTAPCNDPRPPTITSSRNWIDSRMVKMSGAR